MKCFKCEHNNQKKALFCSNCGRDFKGKNKNPSQSIQKDNSSFIQYPHQESITQFNSITQKKKKTSFIIWGLFAVTVILSLFISHEITALLPLLLIGLVITAIAHGFIKKVSEKQYYSLVGARDSSGQHRCVWCGNIGIYKRTIYKTTTTVSSCSKCKHELFSN